MIPFFGIVTAIFFILTADIRGAVLLAGLGIGQSLIILGYTISMMLSHGVDADLELEVKLWDAIVPVVFLTLSSSVALLIAIQFAEVVL
tara:strand:+ start:125 stop:391 length:267 start_codon:yes stop_codon:yes gene_type:complete